MRRRMWLMVAPLALALAGCGGHGNGPGVATAGGPGGQGGPNPSVTASMNGQERALAYTQCMRTHGVDMPDPDIGGTGIHLTMPSGAKNDPHLQAAVRACQQYLPNGGVPQTLSPQAIQQMRNYVQCLRDHGIEISDPDPNTGQLRFTGGDKTQILNDPKFQAAQAACASKQPGKLGVGK